MSTILDPTNPPKVRTERGRAVPAEGAGLRSCPSVPGDFRPLIVHRISVPQCAQRQETGYHRCHRCVYRGRPLNWVYEEPQPFAPAAPVTALPNEIDLPGGDDDAGDDQA